MGISETRREGVVSRRSFDKEAEGVRLDFEVERRSGGVKLP